MKRVFILLFSIAFASITLSCNSTSASKSNKKTVVEIPKPTDKKKVLPAKKSDLPLSAETAIPFLKAYGEKHLENKVRIETPLGSFDVLLFENTPYHRANFIFLTKQKYFNNTYFHRVVPDFIIQGGNSDNTDTGQKRIKIGKYLFPPTHVKATNTTEVSSPCLAAKLKIHTNWHHPMSFSLSINPQVHTIWTGATLSLARSYVAWKLSMLSMHSQQTNESGR